MTVRSAQWTLVRACGCPYAAFWRPGLPMYAVEAWCGFYEDRPVAAEAAMQAGCVVRPWVRADRELMTSACGHEKEEEKAA